MKTSIKKSLKVLCILCFCSVVYGQPEKIEVQGAITIGNSEAGMPKQGTVRWTGSDFEGWNGVIWVSLTGGKQVGTVTDIEGNVYRTIKIGSQEWMVENLKAAKYRAGSTIPQIVDPATWSGLSTAAWCWYDNLSSNEVTYGKIYNWYAVSGDSLCPVGWHVPSDEDWTALYGHLGGEPVAGGKLKEVGTSHWIAPNIASNESGFTALPGGYRTAFDVFPFSQFFNKGYNGYWWSATEVGSSAWILILANANTYATRTSQPKRYGASVRCVKD